MFLDGELQPSQLPIGTARVSIWEKVRPSVAAPVHEVVRPGIVWQVAVWPRAGFDSESGSDLTRCMK